MELQEQIKNLKTMRQNDIVFINNIEGKFQKKVAQFDSQIQNVKQEIVPLITKLSLLKDEIVKVMQQKHEELNDKVEQVSQKSEDIFNQVTKKEEVFHERIEVLIKGNQDKFEKETKD